MPHVHSTEEKSRAQRKNESEREEEKAAAAAAAREEIKVSKSRMRWTLLAPLVLRMKRRRRRRRHSVELEHSVHRVFLWSKWVFLRFSSYDMSYLMANWSVPGFSHLHISFCAHREHAAHLNRICTGGQITLATSRMKCFFSFLFVCCSFLFFFFFACRSRLQCFSECQWVRE